MELRLIEQRMNAGRIAAAMSFGLDSELLAGPLGKHLDWIVSDGLEAAAELDAIQTVATPPTLSNYHRLSESEIRLLALTTGRSTSQIAAVTSTDEHRSDLISELRLAMEELLDSIPPVQARIVRLRLGYPDRYRRTLEWIAAEVGMSREWVRQQERTAYAKLRHPQRSTRIAGLLAEAGSGG